VSGRFLLLVFSMGLPSGALAAQTLAGQSEGFIGAEARVLTFTRLPNVRRLRQIETPIGVVFSLGRLRVDLGSAFVSTELLRVDSSRHSVEHITDTQLRGAYVFGRDAAVVTLALNLPTGPQRASPRDYTVLGAVSPSFLGFPVAAYANGFSVTGGVAAAIPAGDWSFGLAGSLRVSSRFTPYADASGPIVYKPGLEGKLRGGADGLLGSSRFSAGITYSTFGDDQFGAGGTLRGAYSPGPRWLAEAVLLAPVRRSTLSASLWSFRRSAGDTTGASARNKENLTGAELSLAIPVSHVLVFEPGVSGRMSKPQSGRARMLGVGTGFQIRLGERVTLAPTARYDSGWVEDAQGSRAPFHGGYGSAFLRVSF